MYRALGDFTGGAGHVDLSFREPERWRSPEDLMKTSRVAEVPVRSTAVIMGDEEVGPVLLFLWLAEGITPPDAPAHGHASDNWRLSLRGTLPMGRDRYRPGEFRFQKGWKPYASDNYAQGPEGGWSALLFADRRGMRVRRVQDRNPEVTSVDRALAEWLGIGGDLVSEDPADAPGPSGLVTTLDTSRPGAHLNSSFEAAVDWTPVERARVAVALMGEPASGPIVVLTQVEPFGRSLSCCAFDTDVFRMVVRGSHAIGDRTYEAGDMRVDAPGAAFGDVVAGPNGLDEVIVIGDRRSAIAAVDDDDGWSVTLTTMVEDLASRLALVRGAS